MAEAVEPEAAAVGPKPAEDTLSGHIKDFLRDYPKLTHPLEVLEVYSKMLAKRFGESEEDVMEWISDELAKAGYMEIP